MCYLYKIFVYILGIKWAWILGLPEERGPFICEISKEDIYKIIEGDRGPGKSQEVNERDVISMYYSNVVQPVIA